MQGRIRRTIFLAFAAWLSVATCGYADDRLFAGHWYKPGEPLSSMNILQYGETVMVYSGSGWLMAILTPEIGGALATGKGRWMLPGESRPTDVTATIVNIDNRLFALIAPAGRNSPSVVKVILERFEPDDIARKM